METMVTLETLPNLTAQQVFTHVKEHLLRQNKKSALPSGACRYRKDTLSCAAGCLISDIEYAALAGKIEGRGWALLTLDRLVPSKHGSLIKRLQDIHDKSEVKEWPKKLAELAQQENLVF